MAAQVFGNDHAVAFAGSQGNSLNVYKPAMLHNALQSVQLLAEGARSFNDRCAAGIGPNAKRIREHLDNSPHHRTPSKPGGPSSTGEVLLTHK